MYRLQISFDGCVSVERMVARVPATDTAQRPRVVIIGSGFGGAVTARRLAQSGRFDVLLLERGHRYEPGDFPKLRLPDTITFNPEWAYNGRVPDVTRLLWRVDRGLWDLRNLGELQTLQAAGFGGGSLVYAGVHYRAPDVVFRSWPKHRCQHSRCSACTGAHLDGALLAPHYATVEAALGVAPAPDLWKKTTEFDLAASKLGRRTQAAPLAIHFAGQPPPGKPSDSRPCTGCGQCISGCSDGGKNTLDRTYLALAEQDGLRVRTLCEVTSIEALPKQTNSEAAHAPRYRVHLRDHFMDANHDSVEAEYVFLCAGAVNSTELLLASVKCGHLASRGGLTNLGKRYWANGDAFAVAFDTARPWEPGRGPTITRSLGHVEPKSPAQFARGSSLTSVARAEDDPVPDWFLLQNGGLPPNLVPALSLLTSPALFAANAYAPIDDANPRSTPKHWDWFTRAASLNDSPNMAALLAGLPSDVRGLLPKGTTYRELVLRFLEAQMSAARRGIGDGAPYDVRTWLRRGVLSLFSDAHLAEKVRIALTKRTAFGPLLDLPHSVALAAYAVDHFLLGPRPDDNTAVLLAMGADAEWELTYNPRAHHRLFARTKDPARVNRLYRVQERLMRDFAKAAGGQLRTNPAASVGRRPITVHSQGGCHMGADAGRAVVDPSGEVWGHPGLFVVDGSSLPSSVGVNPSHTIAALAELNASHFLERTRRMAYEEEGVPPIPPVHQPNVPRRPLSVQPGSRREFAPLPPISSRVYSDGIPDVEYVPIGTTPTQFVWSERMTGLLVAVDEPDRDSADVTQVLHASGKLLPGDYQARFHRGVFSGTAIELLLDATIPDLDAFLVQSEPVIEITGTVSFRYREPIPHVRHYDARGSLKLRFRVGNTEADAFVHTSPTFVEQTPTMHYDLHLSPKAAPPSCPASVGPGPRRLWGTKLIVDDPGLDAWQDLTTLYTDVATDTDEVCLSGIARVSLQDFVNTQLPSFAVDPRGTAGLSCPQRALALTRFLKRFFGDLARLYDAGSMV